MSVVSHPILHDIIKAYLVYDAENMLSFCSTIPQLKHSKIFQPTSPHRLYDAKPEWFAGGMRHPADGVWRFTAEGFKFPSYYIIHEVKTGHYNIVDEMKKHYIHHTHVSLYIWAYKVYHTENQKIPYSYVKQLDITLLKRYVSSNVNRIIEAWGG